MDKYKLVLDIIEHPDKYSSDAFWQVGRLFWTFPVSVGRLARRGFEQILKPGENGLSVLPG